MYSKKQLSNQRALSQRKRVPCTLKMTQREDNTKQNKKTPTRNNCSAGAKRMLQA